MKKNVILMVVDALTERYVRPRLKDGLYPNLQKLVDRSDAFTSCYSVFPSVTHAALTSIVTGKYPYQHGVMGSHWFEESSGEVPYFSAEWRIMAEMGVGAFLANFIENLNADYVKAETIFQTLRKENKHSTAINFFVYNGDIPHELDLPFLLKVIPGLDINKNTIYGPHNMFLGDLLNREGYPSDFVMETGGMWNWFGLRDEGTFEYLRHLIINDKLSPFNLAYFPKNDHVAHLEGPEEAHDQLVDFDEGLGDLFEAAGGLDEFLAKNTLLIVGDHSQGPIHADAEVGDINLDELLSDFRVSRTGSNWDDDDELLICPNMRSATIYAKPHVKTAAVVEPLLADERIDQVIWQQDGRYFVRNQEAELSFERGSQAVDQFSNSWDIDGDLSVLDAKISEGKLVFDTYPNAFERIEGALLHPDSGRVWVTAKPGAECTVPTIDAHLGGGSHGTLHKEDSVSLLLVASCDRPDEIPQPARLIDIAPLCLSIIQS